MLPEGSQISAWCTRFSRTTVRPLISAAARITSSGPEPRNVRAVNASWTRWVRRMASVWLPRMRVWTTWVTSRKLTSSARVTSGSPQVPAGLDERVGGPVVAPYEFDDQARGADIGEFVDVAAHARRVLGQRHAGGQDQFAALEEGGGVRQFGDVDPADRPVEPGPAGDDLRSPRGQDRQGQDVGDGQRTARGGAARPGVGRPRTCRRTRSWCLPARPDTVTSAADLRNSGPTVVTGASDAPPDPARLTQRPNTAARLDTSRVVGLRTGGDARDAGVVRNALAGRRT
ncbi:hypothetical protein SALBM311S_00893 [Streptomyces alboniger]